MSDVKRLLDDATPLPWRVRRSIHGPKYRHVQIGRDESYTTLDLEPADAALIVHAVNRLPDYEAAVDALEALAAGDHLSADEMFTRIIKGHAALRRLRGPEA